MVPAAYILAGIGALVAGFRIHTGAVSTVLSIGGLLAVIGGTVVWLRRRDYRATRADLLRNLSDDPE
jgi:LPXTG-motif cell wall-anchored protein